MGGGVLYRGEGPVPPPGWGRKGVQPLVALLGGKGEDVVNGGVEGGEKGGMDGIEKRYVGGGNGVNGNSSSLTVSL